MNEHFTYKGKKIKIDVLRVVDKNHRYTNERIVAVNATDIILSPEVSTGLRDHIASVYPSLKTIYYRASVDELNNARYSAVMEDAHPELTVKPEILKRYAPTLELLRKTKAYS